VNPECITSGCMRAPWAGGLCHKHFKRLNAVEISVENKARDYATARGWLAWKFTVLGKVGVPDRIFIGYGRVLFVEFKKLKKVPRLKQAAVIKLMRTHGAEVAVVDNMKDFIKLLNL
jgi:hypothetical protein